MSDDVDRMFRLLVTTMRARSPEELTRPFQVADLHQHILPYRLFRRELGLETNQEYELTLLALLSGAGGYLAVDERMADALGKELESPNPDTGIFRHFGGSEVSIDPDALARVAQHPRTQKVDEPVTEPGSSRGESANAAGPGGAGHGGAMSADSPTAAPPMTPTGRPTVVAAQGETCRFCGGELPAGRPLTYCPHCGQDQTMLHCEACGTELEMRWKYCTTCGRGVVAG
ncbi:MAG: zinc ribbon domain-containing protein [Gemmatimonadaceae bacterium]|nr:zinc ribbon domain-containing protein [Gemmatimonadaceae bacterium]